MSTDTWVKITLLDNEEYYGMLKQPDVLEDLVSVGKKMPPKFIELLKTAKMEWSRSSEDQNTATPTIVPINQPGSRGRIMLAVDSIKTFVDINKESNLVKSVSSHYSPITLAHTMPAGLPPKPGIMM